VAVTFLLLVVKALLRFLDDPRTPSGSGHVGHGSGSVETSQPLGSGIKGSHWVQRPPQLCLIEAEEAVNAGIIVETLQPRVSGIEETSRTLQSAHSSLMDTVKIVAAGVNVSRGSKGWDHPLAAAVHGTEFLKLAEETVNARVTVEMLQPCVSGIEESSRILQTPHLSLMDSVQSVAAGVNVSRGSKCWDHHLAAVVHGTEILPRTQPRFSGFKGTSWVLQPLKLCSKDANLSVDAGDIELHVSRDWDHLLATHLSDPMQHFEGLMGLSVTLSPQPSGGDGPLEVMSSPLQLIIQHFSDELLGLNKTLSSQLNVTIGTLEVLRLESPHRGEPFLRIGLLDSPLPPSPQQSLNAGMLILAGLSPPLQDTSRMDGSQGLNRDTSPQQPGTLELSCPSSPLQPYLGKSFTPQLLKVYHRRQLKRQC
jgi:hypothetical protein